MTKKKEHWRRLDGIILLDKPTGLSSNEALQKVRRLLWAEKGGHTGSLDPMATGLLPICLGEATKLCGVLLDGDKGYETTVQLGVTTDTGDVEGFVRARVPVSGIHDERIEEVLASLRGPQMQRPPMHSAIKRDGVPLYKLARSGIEVEREPRPITIYDLTMLNRGSDWLRLCVRCSKGTYIRVLGEDIGAALGVGAHLTSLRRTYAQPFASEAMHELAHIQGCARDQWAVRDLLMPLEVGLQSLPRIDIELEDALRIRKGQMLRIDSIAASHLSPPPHSDDANDAKPIAVFCADKAVALARVQNEFLKATRVFSAD
jgi:tRNA pseudouridine55 synthase